MGRIVGADAVLGLEIVENLGIASAEQIGDEGVRACGRVVGRFRERVIAFEADVVAWALLKADLKGIIEGFGAETSEATKRAIELWEWAQ